MLCICNALNSKFQFTIKRSEMADYEYTDFMPHEHFAHIGTGEPDCWF